MKISFITMAFVISTLPVFYQQGSVQPVSRLAMAIRLNRSHLMSTMQSMPARPTDRVAPAAVCYRDPGPMVPVKITDTDGKIAMFFRINALPLQLSMSYSGIGLKRARLTYIHNIF